MAFKIFLIVILGLNFLGYAELFNHEFHLQNCKQSLGNNTNSHVTIVPLKNGTAYNIEEIIKGRCYFYLNLQRNSNCGIVPVNYDCNSIWNAFKNAVIRKSPCDIKIEDFKEFFKLASHSVPSDSSVFWSGTYNSYHDIVKLKSYLSLEDTFSGYLLDGLRFCSSNALSDFNYETCPFDCVSINSVFWNAASIEFAKKASGHVRLILNGTRTIGAISNSSTFMKYELPYLENNMIDTLSVFLLHTPGQKSYETCLKPKTLNYLKSILKYKEIKYECHDNPEQILLLMCFNDINAKECKHVKKLIHSNEIAEKSEEKTIKAVEIIKKIREKKAKKN